MDISRRALPRVLIPVLVVVAIAGYLVGIHRGSSSTGTVPTGGLLVASGANVLLEYPPSWRPSASAPTLPGLSLARPLVLAPAGNASRAGLISGQLAAGASSPLPTAFLGLIHGVPHVEVVTLTHLQAYSFSRLNGYQRTLDVYVIPTVGGSPTALVCYAPSASSGYLRECEQIVGTVTLVGQSSFNLTPDAQYADRLATAIGTLDSERTKLRREIRASSAPATLAALAKTLTDRFASALTTVTALEAPQAASAAQAALTTSLAAARGAYASLASAAAAEDVAGYAAAEQQVAAAETAVDGALEDLALIGYNHT